MGFIAEFFKRQTMMDKIKKVLSSRTVWTIVLMGVVNALPAVRDQLPANLQSLVDVILSIAAISFHVSPRQDFTQ